MVNRNKKLFLTALLIVLFGGIFISAGVVWAQTGDLGISQVSSTLSLGNTDVRLIVAKIIRAALGLLGIIVVCLMLYGGFLYMTAGGNEEQITSAKNLIKNSVIGLAIILSAYAITSFVLKGLMEATGMLPAHCMNDEWEQDTEDKKNCGKECPPCYTPPECPGCVLDPNFHIVSYPSGGDVCVMNFHPTIVFSEAVDITTMSWDLTAVVHEKDRPAEKVEGEWKILDSRFPWKATFIPKGACSATVSSGCFTPSTTYYINLTQDTPVLLSASQKPLKCGALYPSYPSCTSPQFTTGVGYDDERPTVRIINTDSQVNSGANAPVTVEFTDNYGLQLLDLSVRLSDNRYWPVDTSPSPPLSGCATSGVKILEWPTTGWEVNRLYELLIVGTDFAAQTAEATKEIFIRPGHCDNGIQDGADREIGIDCGVNSGCGRCANEVCGNNDDCASGFCSIPPGQTLGVCVNRLRIDHLDPLDGAVGNYLTISGRYFGNNKGQVFFKDAANNRIEASLPCANFNPWKDYQIIAQVPPGAVTGPIEVVAASIDTHARASGYKTDITSNTLDFSQIGWGLDAEFTVNNTTRPGLCAIAPTSSRPNNLVNLFGNNFGVNGGIVKFGDWDGTVRGNWFGENIYDVAVPQISAGLVGVKVRRHSDPAGVYSNSVRFFVLAGSEAESRGADSGDPEITSITPTAGANGEYITINGDFFGDNQGQVWFKKNGTEQKLNCASCFNFPDDCKNKLWSNKKILVKFPRNQGETYVDGDYSVQVVRASDYKVSAIKPNTYFNLRSSNKPRPGLCAINPDSGPVPFPVGKTMQVFGDYFEFTGINNSFPPFDTHTQPVFTPVRPYAPSLSLNNNLLAHWTFDSATVSGNIINDVSGFGHHLVNNRAILENNVIKIDSTVAGAFASSSAFAISSPESSIAFWVKASNVTAVQNIFDWRTNVNGGSGISMYRGSTGNPPGIFYFAGNLATVSNLATPYFLAVDKLPTDLRPVNLWHHVAFVFKNNGTIEHYQDGSLAHSFLIPNFVSWNFANTPFILGNKSTVATVLTVDDFRVYSRALLSTEISELNSNVKFGSQVFNSAPQARAIISPASGVAPLSVNFSASGSTDSDGFIASYSWNFGDGSAMSSEQNINHIYSAPGIYETRLIITDNQGAQDTVIVTTTVNIPTNNARSGVYFANPGGVAGVDGISGRARAVDIVSTSTNMIVLRPPVEAKTGAVVFYRGSDNSMSNELSFAKNNCLETGNQCASGKHCCFSGQDSGFCKLNSERCEGQVISSGYVWRFSPKDIPPPLRVVEKCGDDLSLSVLPSPSPSMQWNAPHDRVCLGALLVVEFSHGADLLGHTMAPIDANNLVVKKCVGNDVVLSKRTCKTDSNNSVSVVNMMDYVAVGETDDNPSNYRLRIAGGDEKHTNNVVTLLPSNGQWEPNTWYWVALSDRITAGIGASSTNLRADQPCDTNNDGKDDAPYCFLFKTGIDPCTLGGVTVIPSNHWTNYLEAPLRHHTFNSVQDLFYVGMGLSNQRCIAMDARGYDWLWTAPERDSIEFAKIYSSENGVADTGQIAQVESWQNTVGVGLTTAPTDAVNILATASTGTAPYRQSFTGISALTIDLSKPKVVEAWPNCLETCTDAAIGVRFNINMLDENLNLTETNGPIHLLRCLDENCLSTSSTPLRSSSLSPGDESIIEIIPSSTLEKETIYQVVISRTYDSVSNNNPPTDILWGINRKGSAVRGKPFIEQYTWRFRTKKEACKVDRVEVTPDVFVAPRLNARTIFSVMPYSAPDACSAKGQKLNAYGINWQWKSLQPLIATTTSFATVGYNRYCTRDCVRRGSDIPFGGTRLLSACGDGRVDAGEDCDIGAMVAGQPIETARSCSLTCLRPGNTTTISARQSSDQGKCGDGFVSSTLGEECDPNGFTTSTRVNCGSNCLWTGSRVSTGAMDIYGSICGNGYQGAGEDCDLGIKASSTVVISALGCTANCLHQGTRLSNLWCFNNTSTFAGLGFTTSTYNFYCDRAYSQCGDGESSPNEDPGCEESLTANITPPICNEFCQTTTTALGSSLLHNVPSVCGDGKVGVGEVPFCEQLTDFFPTAFINPWALVIGQGMSVPTINTVTGRPEQVAEIEARTKTPEKTTGKKEITDIGKFVIPCGYETDAECENAPGFGSDYGVGADSCCYFKPKLVEVYPGVTSSVLTPDSRGICRNTYISASFDHPILRETIAGNFFIARDVSAVTTTCVNGTTNVTELVLAEENKLLPWYARVWRDVIAFARELFGRNDAQAVVWCAGQDIGSVEVKDKYDGNNLFRTSTLIVHLRQPLAPDTDYRIILTNGIKDYRGVSIGLKDLTALKKHSFGFHTGEGICEVNQAVLTPAEVYFARANATTTMFVNAKSNSGQQLQSIQGVYAWNHIWGPINPFVQFFSSTTITEYNELKALPQNGEIDVFATVNVIDNNITATKGPVATGKAHAIVFLCENPWPPKDQLLSNGQVARIFPYEDKVGNNDGFSLVSNTFNNLPVAASAVKESGTSGYYNFRTFYCADSGSTGTGDDLPFLRAAVQTTTAQLEEVKGICSFTGEGCDPATDGYKQCKSKYTDISKGTVFYWNDFSYFDIATNRRYYSRGNAAFCIIGNSNVASSSDLYYLDGNNNPLECSDSADCNDSNFVAWRQDKINERPGFYFYTKCSVPDYLLTYDEAICIAQPQPLKRFILTDTNPRGVSDAIGIQVFSNKYFLTPRDWLSGNELAGGKDFNISNLRDLKIDGYDAVSDGNNVYVEALNYSSDWGGGLKSTIYLFSLNINAGSAMKNVFEQMMKNLHLNTNLDNFNYCVRDLSNLVLSPTSTPCQTDLDCAKVEPAGQKCANQIEKLKRNYQRLRGLSSIEQSLNSYFEKSNSDPAKRSYPTLTEGTYLSGQTISTWPSWSVLGSKLGRSLPSDPINRLAPAGSCVSTTNPVKYCLTDSACQVDSDAATPTNPFSADTCLIHDPTTGWETKDRRFSFACNSDSLAYRYIASTTTLPSYTVRYLLEPNSANLSNTFNSLIPKFIKGSNFDRSTGICSQSNELTTMQSGFCGDGKLNLNLGEQCDPPGAKIYEEGCTENGGALKKVQICGVNNIGGKDVNCQWTDSTTPCGSLSVCGNGRVETNETCDDGVLNGRYNQCNSDCKGFGSAGTCGDGVLDQAHEFCDTKDATATEPKKCVFSSGVVVDPLTLPPEPVIYFLIDLSGSMDWSFSRTDTKTRLQYIKEQMPLVAQALVGKAKIGIATFRKDVGQTKEWMESTLMFDNSSVTNIVNQFVASNGTPTGAAINWVNDNVFANLNITDPQRVKNLILITDGDESDGTVPPASTIILQLLGNNIKTYVIGVAQTSPNFALWAGLGGTGDYIRIDSASDSMVGVLRDIAGSYDCWPYYANKNRSCKSDCSGFGSYCGDGVVNASFGEECEADETCSLSDGRSGIRKCVNCKKQSATAEWRMDNLVQPTIATSSRPTPGGSRINFYATSTAVFGGLKLVSVNEVSSTASNDYVRYPSIVNGNKIGQAFNFEGSDAVRIHNDLTEVFTWSLWIKPAAATTFPATIIEKGGMDTNYCGFTLRREVNGDLKLYAMNSGQSQKCNVKNYLNPIIISSAAPNNVWTHLALLHDGAHARLYVNGEEKAVSPTALTTVANCGYYSFGADNWWGSGINDINPPNLNGCPASSASVNGNWLVDQENWYWYTGQMDELQYFNRPLTTAEVKDLYNRGQNNGDQWMCSSTIPVTTPNVPGSCGNGRQEENEACDDSRMDALGNVIPNSNKNGIVCEPGYNRPCTYCSADCRNVIRREASGYCGDGVINGAEHCDVDPANKYAGTNVPIIYVTSSITTGTDSFNSSHNGRQAKLCASEKNTLLNGASSGWADADLITHKKGFKSCVNNCLHFDTNNCVECGSGGATGVNVSGKIVNVLEPNTVAESLFANPLYVSSDTSGTINFVFTKYPFPGTSKTRVAYKTWNTSNSATINQYTLKRSPSGGSAPTAVINPNQNCSLAVSDSDERYRLALNADYYDGHIFDFPIVSEPAPPWQYDLVLSPVISPTSVQKLVVTSYTSATPPIPIFGTVEIVKARPKDIRVVLSYVSNLELLGGFKHSSNQTWEGASWVGIGGITYGSNYSSGDNRTGAGKRRGVWYHGLSELPLSYTVEAFTVDNSSDGSGTQINNWLTSGFYVRAPAGDIASFRGSKVKVEVYLPEDDSYPVSLYSLQHFARPALVFDLDSATASDNPVASYWYVFKIVKPSSDQARINLSDIIPVNSIKTNMNSL